MDRPLTLADIEKSILPVGSRARNIVMLIYGEHGVGKTTFAAKGPNPLFLMIEPTGDDSLLGHPTAKKVEVFHWTDLEPVYAYLMQPNTSKTFQTLVVDTLSEMQELAIRKVIGKTGRTDRSRLITDESKQLTMQQWGEVGRYMSEIIRKLILLSDRYHVILLGQLKMQTDERGNKYLGPDLSPASIKPAERLLSIIGQLESDPENQTDLNGRVIGRKFRNRLTIIPTGDAEGKDRSSGLWIPKEQRLPPVMTNPDLSEIISIYRGEKLPDKKN
jgi:hypothetical protein